MLTAQQIKLVKDTVPVLQAHGMDVTTHFYKRMLSGNPELRHIFNVAHQAKGEQQRALAMAVLAYAANIENPTVLAGAIRQIAVKHCAVGIRAEQYQIVGHHLLASIKEVLGDAATPELIDAWAAAYTQLADILIKAESDLYVEQTGVPGGWSGWRAFKCVNRVQECDNVVSFYLEPSDGGKVSCYLPGQFITVRPFVKALGLNQPRQYTISRVCQGEDNKTIRITVKRLVATADRPQGQVSNDLHNNLQIGDTVEVSAPAGDFVIDDLKADHPIVFAAAGIGITPFIPMLQALVEQNPNREVHFLYSTQNSAQFPLRAELESAIKSLPNASLAVFYTQPAETDHLGQQYNAQGRISAAKIRTFCQHPDADFYLCGPTDFMKDISHDLKSLGIIDARIHLECFGTGSLD